MKKFWNNTNLLVKKKKKKKKKKVFQSIKHKSSDNMVRSLSLIPLICAAGGVGGWGERLDTKILLPKIKI